MTIELLESGLALTTPGLMALCRQFGLPVPAAGTSGQAGCWLQAPEKGASLEAACAALERGEVPAGTLISYALVPENWGCARLEVHYSEDLVHSPAAGTRELDRIDTLRQVPEKTAQDMDLQQLFADLRGLLGERDWLVFFGREAASQRLWLLGVFPWGWDWPAGPWIPLPDAPLPPLLTPLSRGILQRAANDWLDLLVPEMRESEVSAYDWFESLAGRLLLPTGRFQALLGYTPGQPGAIQLKDLSRLTSIRKHLRRLSKQIWDTFVVSHPRFQGNLQQWQEICRLFLPAYLELGALIRSLAAGLESSESLAAYLADHLNPSSRLHDQLIPLWERVQDQLAEAAADEDADPGQMSEKMLGQPEFKRQWQLFMSHYGHYAPFALDLAYPRLFDQPEALIETLMQPWSSDDFTGVWNKRGWLERPRWQQLARIIDLRENFLNDVLWALHQLRIRMQARAEELVTAGRLESAADIWWLTPTELGRLDLEQSVPPGLVAMRRAQQQSWQATWRRLAGEAELADTDDADDTGGSDQGHVLMGQGLQTLMVVGKVWWLDAPAIHLPEGYEPGRTILVTETVDPGWIPCLEQVGGVILTGCDVLSAAAIMLRELGKPAIIALPQAAALAEGQWLRLNTETGTVSLIEEVS